MMRKPSTRSRGWINGVLLAGALVAAVKQALDVYKTPERWREMQRAAMAGDFSWDVSAREYVKVYSVNS